MSLLAERVLKNEEARHGNAGRVVKRHRDSASVFAASLIQTRHPLDRKFRCGFDPQGVTIKQYRVHIANCQNQDCIERHHRWLDLMEYFR